MQPLPRREPDIAAAARQLFTERGWAGTRVRDVAAAAGVAEPTVYAVYGSKAALALALIDAAAEAADLGVQEADLTAAAGDPAGQLAAMAGFDRRLFERGGDVLGSLHDAGRAEPDLAAAYREGRAQADRVASGSWAPGRRTPSGREWTPGWPPTPTPPSAISTSTGSWPKSGAGHPSESSGGG